jgi:ribonuclease P protein subunit POP4
MTTRRDLVRHEIVGLEAQIEHGSSSNPVMHFGKILYETKNCLVLRDKGNVKIIPKSSVISLSVEFDDGVCFIKGSSLLGRPEDRVFR